MLLTGGFEALGDLLNFQATLGSGSKRGAGDLASPEPSKRSKASSAKASSEKVPAAHPEAGSAAPSTGGSKSVKKVANRSRSSKSEGSSGVARGKASENPSDDSTDLEASEPLTRKSSRKASLPLGSPGLAAVEKGSPLTPRPSVVETPASRESLDPLWGPINGPTELDDAFEVRVQTRDIHAYYVAT